MLKISLDRTNLENSTFRTAGRRKLQCFGGWFSKPHSPIQRLKSLKYALTLYTWGQLEKCCRGQTGRLCGWLRAYFGALWARFANGIEYSLVGQSVQEGFVHLHSKVSRRTLLEFHTLNEVSTAFESAALQFYTYCVVQLGALSFFGTRSHIRKN